MSNINNPNMARILITPDQRATKNDAWTVPTQGVSSAARLTTGNAAPHVVEKAATDTKETGFWGEDGFTFGDLLDLVNPLQHIPIVSNIYRAITGDEIGVGPRLIGGAVLGGVVGFAGAVVNAAVEAETGKDIGGNVLAMAIGDPKSSANAGTEKGIAAPTLIADTSIEPEVPEERQAVADDGSMALPTFQALPEWQPGAEADREGVEVISLPGSGQYKPGIGLLDAANLQYRHTQMIDMLQKTAMNMRV